MQYALKNILNAFSGLLNPAYEFYLNSCKIFLCPSLPNYFQATSKPQNNFLFFIKTTCINRKIKSVEAVILLWLFALH